MSPAGPRLHPEAQPTVVGSDASLCCCCEGSCLLFFPALHVSPSLFSSSPFSPLSQFSCLLFSFFPPSLLSSRVLVPALLCWALFSSHACAGFALDLRCVRLVCGACAGLVLRLCWASMELAPGLLLLWSCAACGRLALGLRWACAGLALGSRWAFTCAGVVLLHSLCCACTGPPRCGRASGRRAGLHGLTVGARIRTERLRCADQARLRVGIRGVCFRGGAKARYNFEHRVLSRWGRRAARARGRLPRR